MSTTEKTEETFVYKYPSFHFDGTPYEAAEKTVDQVEKIVRLLALGLKDTYTQALNAHMERNLHATGIANSTTFADTAEARLLLSLVRVTKEWQQKKLPALKKSVAFDPSGPLPKQ